MGRRLAIRAALLAALAVPVVAAAFSPLLQWRQPIYVAAGFAGILAMTAMAVQPLAAAGALPGLSALAARWLHRVVGAVLVILVAAHVGGLWITSPPDVVDALLLRSPTPFSVWGVLAMWAVLGAALVALARRRLGLRWVAARRWHMGLAVTAVAGTVAHVLPIDGTMEPLSKYALSGIVLAAAGWAVVGRAFAARP